MPPSRSDRFGKPLVVFHHQHSHVLSRKRRGGARSAWSASAGGLGRRAVRSARWAWARDLGNQRRAAWLAVMSAGIVLLAAACGGGSPGPAASPGQALYRLR
jgi:hypothetical protein